MTKPILKYVEAIKIHGFSTRTRNSDECELKTAKIPTLWQHFYSSPLASASEIYGVYSNYESDVNGFYTLTAGTPVAKHKMEPNEIVIQPGNYLVFDNEGALPHVVIKTWQQIWQYFANNPRYQRNFLTDFEYYSGKDKISIYIGIILE